MKKVIVTGANGFIGSSLIKRLIKENTYVLAISLSFNDSKLPDSNNIRKIESDLTNLDELKLFIGDDEYDAFYNFAWQGVNGPDKARYDVQINNIMLSLKCAELAKNVSCKKYLSAGTIAERSVESLPELTITSSGMIYGSAKACNHTLLETYCKNIGLDFVWMQFSNIYGPQNKTGNLISYTLGELFNGQKATFGPAEQPYDFIYIDDLLEAIFRLGFMKTKRNCYFIGSGTPRILKDYLIRIGELCNMRDNICIGIRQDDGIKYSFEMFSIDTLVADIGNYVSSSFDEGIKATIVSYK